MDRLFIACVGFYVYLEEEIHCAYRGESSRKGFAF